MAEILPPEVQAVLADESESFWLRDSMLYLLFENPTEAENNVKRLYDAVKAWRQVVDFGVATAEVSKSIN